MRNPFKNVGTVLKLAGLITQLQQLNKQGASMKKYLPIILTLGATLSSALAFPEFVKNHAVAYGILNAVAQALHAVLPGIFNEAQSQ